MRPSDPRVSVECFRRARCLRSFARYVLAMREVNVAPSSQYSLQNDQPSRIARELSRRSDQPAVESYPPLGVVGATGVAVIGDVVAVAADVVVMAPADPAGAVVEAADVEVEPVEAVAGAPA